MSDDDSDDELVIPLVMNAPQRAAFSLVKPGNTVHLAWGRGVGKSWLIRCVWWLLISEWENKLRANAPKPFTGVRITALMPTLKQFKDVHWAGIEGELGPGGDFEFLGAKFDRQRAQIKFPGGSLVRPFPASLHNSKAARGMRTDVLSCDEVDDIDAAVYDGTAQPWISEPWSLKIALLGGTPTRGRHGLWWRMLADARLGDRLRAGENLEHEDEKRKKALKSIYAIHSTYRDSPETMDADAVDKARATMPKATFEREYEANPDAGEGLVYVFDDLFHVRNAPEGTRFAEFLVGVDHGWVDPGVMLLIGIQGHGNDATAWVIDEWYETECPNQIWDARALAWKHAKFWPDPSRPDRIADIRRQGCQVGETDNNILGGISRVADMLHRRKSPRGDKHDVARLYVSPKCRNTIREFGLYRRKKHPDGTFSDDPEDKNQHSLDSLRYALTGRFGRGGSYRHVVSGR